MLTLWFSLCHGAWSFGLLLMSCSPCRAWYPPGGASWPGFLLLRSIFLKDAPKRLGLPAIQVLLSADAAADAGLLMSESSAENPEPVFDDLVAPPVDL